MTTRSLVKKLNLEKDQLDEELNQQNKLREELKMKIHNLNQTVQGWILTRCPSLPLNYSNQVFKISIISCFYYNQLSI